MSHESFTMNQANERQSALMSAASLVKLRSLGSEVTRVGSAGVARVTSTEFCLSTHPVSCEVGKSTGVTCQSWETVKASAEYWLKVGASRKVSEMQETQGSPEITKKPQRGH